ncbi:hypothetical protein [Granulicella mallensis]|uniref:Uncharacterized protein n=1 Tax=Granulicella mallensis TaxID=940614 RepID=A0A7W7ZKU9_9BACT|nr:hypothetical protein [Granulicella mallensis]MBB5061718.1 hypothetical protein [Granulicella mallensis]
MSFVRKAADRIAGLVVRYASPGSKEWAQAIESELLYIESDWRALGWALSGMRVLFDTQPAPLRTLADLDAEAQKHAERRRHAVNNGWLVTNVPLFVPLVFALESLVDIALGRHIFSNTVLLLGLLLLAPMLYLRSREPNVPDRDDPTGLVRFYVDELSATSSNSLTFWMFVVGASFMVVGFELATGFGWQSVIPLLLLLPALALLLAKHRKNRRRLAQVEALLDTMSNSSF